MDTSTSATTQSPNPANDSPLHVKVRDLERHEFEEERSLAEEFSRTLDCLIQALLPVMKYVAQLRVVEDRRIKAIQVMARCGLGMFLTEWGKFFSISLEKGKAYRPNGCDLTDYLNKGSDDWKDFFFDEVIQSLQVVFENATNKKEEHLASLKKRSDMLRQITATIVAATGKEPAGATAVA